MNGNFTLKDGLVISIGNKSAFPILFERSKVILLYVKMKDLSTDFTQNFYKKEKIFILFGVKPWKLWLFFLFLNR